MLPNRLTGTWRLVSWENRASDQEITHPLGTNPVGYLTYDEDGFMSVSIMRRDRAPFATGDLLTADADELRAAAETYVSYCGRYDLYDDRVVHHVELSLFPNWIGEDQERLVELSGSRLTLSTHPMLLAGRLRTARLVWERA